MNKKSTVGMLLLGCVYVITAWISLLKSDVLVLYMIFLLLLLITKPQNMSKNTWLKCVHYLKKNQLNNQAIYNSIIDLKSEEGKKNDHDLAILNN